MTTAEYNDILAKECLRAEDIQKLYGFNGSQASEFMNKLKYRLTKVMGRELRLDMRGRIHTQDYRDALGLDSIRYATVIIREKEKSESELL